MPSINSIYAIEGSLLTNIASAIRAKTGSSSAFTPAQMASEIMNIPGGGGGGLYDGVDWEKTVPPCGNVISLNSSIVSYFDSSATIVMKEAFYNCMSLTDISFPNVRRIEEMAFWQCRSLSSILYFPECRYIGPSAFNEVRSISSSALNIMELSFPECQVIREQAFKYLTRSISSIFFPKCVEIDAEAFYGAFKTAAVDFPNCKYVGARAFAYCSLLQYASFPECCAIDESAFLRCSAFSQIAFPNCQYLGSHAFTSCTRLVSISLQKLKTIPYGTFNNCGNLITISVPECNSISDYAFASCSHLNVDCLDWSKIEEIGRGAFSGIGQGGAVIDSKVIDLTNCRSIGSSAFMDTGGIKEVIVSDGCVIYSSAFYRCTRLDTFTIQDGECILMNSNVFFSTSFSYGQGTIRVPSSLYSQYYNDSVWSWFRSVLTSI